MPHRVSHIVFGVVLAFLAAAAPAAEPITLYDKQNAPAAPKREELKLAGSVTRCGITWTFEKPAPVGQFVNGDWYVVGPVTVKAIDPRPLFGDEVTNVDPAKEKGFEGKYVRNGSVLNLPAQQYQSGFDSRVPHSRYKPNLPARLPIAMKPGDALLSSISFDKPRSDLATKSYSVLTCLKEPVPADAFRPSYCDRAPAGGRRAEQVIYLARNLRRDLLPRLAVPKDMPKGVVEPNLSQLAALYERTWNETSFFEADAAEYQRGGYGRGVCEVGARATLALLLDHAPREKEPLLVNFVQYGIDIWGIVRGGHPGWQAHGGWGSGRKWPVVFAGLLLGDDQMAHVNKTFPKTHFQEDMQVMYDDCWTGAGVVYAGHIGPQSSPKSGPGWGAFENVHPSRWPAFIGSSYRNNMTSSTWVGLALAIRILGAEDAWNNNAFMDYCDRWMYESDPGYGTGDQVQGETWDRFVAPMWKAYREHLPPPAFAAGPGKATSRPTTGWMKERPMKSVAAQIGQGGELRVEADKKPFFPIMVFAERPERIEDAKAIGANIIAEGSFESSDKAKWVWNEHVNNREFLDKLAAAGMYGVFGADMRAAGHPALLGWIHVDQPDAVLAEPNRANWRRIHECCRWMVTALMADKTDRAMKALSQPVSNDAVALTLVTPAFEWMRKTDKSRPVFLTVGPQFLKAAKEGRKELCEGYLKACDVIGYSARCACVTGGAEEAVDHPVRRLVELGKGKPVYAWVETLAEARPTAAAAGKSKSASAPAPASLDPGDVRVAVWTAILDGARGIGYRGFEGFNMSVKPDAAVLAEMKKINAKLALAAPGIFAPPAGAKVSASITGRGTSDPAVRATESDGALYVFALNTDVAAGGKLPRGGKVTAQVEGLKAGTKVEVVGEDRAITAGEGSFADDFAPLAEHVYRIAK